jgi:N-glycosylase/DNA lyase
MSLNLVTGILNVAKNDLNLKFCLRGGMSFRWTVLSENNNESEFNGVIGDRIYFLKQIPSKEQIEFKTYSKETLSKDKVELELRDYFRLNENLKDLYTEWSQKDVKFDEKVKLYPEVLSGIRVLRLDPVENLFSFICSSNNNIKRITQMVGNMCIHFGSKIGKVENVDYYSFPTIKRLAQKDVEDKLRKLNFGYRAKFIYQAALYLQNNQKDRNFLFELRDKPYTDVVNELIKIPGIGKKVKIFYIHHSELFKN